jgi:hypothetical protein
MEVINEAYPTLDKNGQWWHAGQPVRMVVVSEEEKQQYLNKMKNAGESDLE